MQTIQKTRVTNIKNRTSRGGGAPKKQDVSRKTLFIKIKNGVPQYIFTKGAQKKMEIIKEELSFLPPEDIDSDPAKLHQPFLGVFGWRMPSEMMKVLVQKYGHKDLKSLRKFFSEMGMRYEDSGGIVELSFDVEGYKKNGYKLHVGGNIKFKPDIVFHEI